MSKKVKANTTRHEATPAPSSTQGCALTAGLGRRTTGARITRLRLCGADHPYRMARRRSRADRVIIFDGECNLCSAWVDFVLRRDASSSFRFAAQQSAAARRLLGRLGAQSDDLGSIALVVGHDVYTRSDAVLRIFSELPFPWKAVWAFVLVPRCLRDPVYSLVSRTRYRLFGRRTTCRLGDPEDHERFL